MTVSSAQLVRFIEKEFHALADPAKAVPMQAYMKTAEPFYGIQKPARARIFREMKKRFAPATRREYEAGIRALWRLPHREEKYAAIEYAVQSPALITGKSLPLYEKLIREGAWWDLVDPVAVWLVARVLLAERRPTRPIMARWIGDEDLWIRRAALLSQIRHKEATDERQLFAHCLRCAPDQAFFVRKAIGWALRDYSYTAPRCVRRSIAGRDRSPQGKRRGLWAQHAACYTHAGSVVLVGVSVLRGFREVGRSAGVRRYLMAAEDSSTMLGVFRSIRHTSRSARSAMWASASPRPWKSRSASSA